MFNNIGGKIKALATIIAGLGIVFCIAYGIALFVEDFIKLGLIILIGGSLLSWIGSFTLYGFGQLVENSDKLAKLQEKEYNAIIEKERLEKEEEYKKEFEKIQKEREDYKNGVEVYKKIKKENKENLKKEHEEERIRRKEQKKEDLKRIEMAKEESARKKQEQEEAEKRALQDISSSLKEKIKKVLSETKTKIENLKKLNEDWFEQISGLTNKELVSRIDNDHDWQYSYIVLCCYEYNERLKESSKKK